MAELAGERGERGQLLLVFAIGLAVAFVTLALILNAAVVTELHASTATQGLAAERDVAAYEHDVRVGIGGLIASVNAQNADNVTPLEDDVATGTEAWNQLARRQYVADAAMTDVVLNNTTPGTRIVQHDGNRTVTNRSSAANWAVIDDSSRVRGFRLNVTRDGLATANESCASCFTVTIDTGETSGAVRVYDDGNDIVVEEPDSGTTCIGRNESAVVDLSNGSVDGQHCPALEFAASVTELDRVEFANGDSVQATYQLIVDRELAIDPHFSETEDPTLEPAVYAAIVSVSYRSTGFQYASTLEVVPEGSR